MSHRTARQPHSPHARFLSIAIVGALLIQSLDNGMVLMDVSSPKRQIFIGLVLIVAVWFDVVYNRKQGK